MAENDIYSNSEIVKSLHEILLFAISPATHSDIEALFYDLMIYLEAVSAEDLSAFLGIMKPDANILGLFREIREGPPKMLDSRRGVYLTFVDIDEIRVRLTSAGVELLKNIKEGPLGNYLIIDPDSRIVALTREGEEFISSVKQAAEPVAGLILKHFLMRAPSNRVSNPFQLFETVRQHLTYLIPRERVGFIFDSLRYKQDESEFTDMGEFFDNIYSKDVTEGVVRVKNKISDAGTNTDFTSNIQITLAYWLSFLTSKVYGVELYEQRKALKSLLDSELVKAHRHGVFDWFFSKKTARENLIQNALDKVVAQMSDSDYDDGCEETKDNPISDEDTLDEEDSLDTPPSSDSLLGEEDSLDEEDTPDDDTPDSPHT